jgi:hypothetical protein
MRARHYVYLDYSDARDRYGNLLVFMVLSWCQNTLTHHDP